MKTAKGFSPTLYPLFLIALLFITGCQTQSLYVPNAHPTPLFKEQGEVYVAGGGGSGGFQGQAAYAVLKGVSLNAAYNMNNYEKDGSTHEQQYGEFSLGFFNPETDWLVTELFFGYGSGKAEFLDNEYQMLANEKWIDTALVQSSFNKLFLQYNIGITSPYIDAGAALRFNQVFFKDYKSNHESFDIGELTTSTYTFEPAIFMSVGRKWIKLDAQVMYPITMKDASDSELNGVQAYVGLKFLFGRDYSVYQK